MSESEIDGGEAVLGPRSTVLVGEIHGTWEIPVLVAALLRDALEKSESVIFCVEISSAYQSQIEQFVESSGDQAAINRLLQNSFWSGQDGRSSIGMFAMLELVRRIRDQGGNVRVQAIDYESYSAGESANHRDSIMAKNLLRVRDSAPEATLICLSGSVHANKNRGAPWNKEYVPMGYRLNQSISNLVSLNVRHSGGEAWVITEHGTGPTPMNGQQQGETPFIQLNDHDDESGFDGFLYVGQITAARPAIVVAEE